ncbi:MAG: trypsin-like peptidase domain-containing protein [Planctomycetaceae bacterium]|nr:trypsin-like peptidase domain-containing protein [Planctomycetaceae bacterium]
MNLRILSRGKPATVSVVLVALLLIADRGRSQDLPPTPTPQTPTPTMPTPPTTAEESTQVEVSDAPKELTIPELSRRINRSLVIVKATGRDGSMQGHGTGFVISPDGLIATARHVIGDGRQVAVVMPNGQTANATHVYGVHESIDVAIIKVDGKEMDALPLCQEDAIETGASVVAVGHPGNRTNTTVSGIIAGTQDIDGIRLLELAMPIEPGSSGEPVVNRAGEVVGVVVMKSTLERSLGYAVPVRHLRDLLAEPTPIPMKRWITIGALDPKRWQIVFDAAWSQRAGRIKVDGPGNSFGGRSLCLQTSNPPPVPFDVQVEVKLADEAGAAGLVFHSDGGDRHYGYYPSDGNIRLTRFDGPDVYSWNILHNEPHDAYRPGEWNTFRVRVEEGRMICWLNQQLVLESQDNGLTSGRVGLATFRGTIAEFRRFKVASDLPSGFPDENGTATIEEVVGRLSMNRPPEAKDVEQLQEIQGYASLLQARAKRLEKQAERVRELAKEVHASVVRDALLQTLNPVNDSAPDLMKAALLIAVLDNEEVDPAPYIDRLDQLADEVRGTLPEKATQTQTLQAMDRILFEEYAFRGSKRDYYTASNSYLNEVIDDREGLPITLSVLYMELARRLDLAVAGVALPGHFVVRFEPTDGSSENQIIDVFDRGRRLTRPEAEKIITSRGLPLEPEYFESRTPTEIIVRMLHNLLNLAEADRNNSDVLRYLETLVLLDPGDLESRVKRLEIRARTGRITEAIEDIDWLIEQPIPSLNKDGLYQYRAQLQQRLPTP